MQTMRSLAKKLLYFVYGLGGINPFFNIFSHQYLATYLLNADLKRRFAQITGGGNVLDLGCGMKPYKRFTSDNATYLGVDVYAESMADKLMIDDKEIPYNDNLFDWVVSTNAIEHIKELDFVVDELKRVTKQDAKFIISIPFIFNEHGAPFDFRRFTRFGMEEYFKSKGFLVLETKIFGGIGTFIIVGFFNWLDITFSSFRIGILLKILLAPIYLPIVAIINLIGICLNKIDLTQSFYSSVLVQLKKDTQ